MKTTSLTSLHQIIMSKHFSRDRLKMRESLLNANGKNLLPDDNDNLILKHLLITIAPNKSNYSISSFAKKIRIINAMLNKKLYKRKFKQHPNRIVFFNFIEYSKTKNLTHNHFIIRTHKSFSSTNKIIELMSLLKTIVDKFEFKFDYRFRNNAVEYATKHFSENNDNLIIN